MNAFYRSLGILIHLLLSFSVQAQISDSLYAALPPDKKPQNRHRLTSREKGDVLQAVFYLYDKKYYKETDQLASELENGLEQDKVINKRERISLLSALGNYYLNKDLRIEKALSYFERVLELCGSDSFLLKERAMALAQKSYIYSQRLNRVEEAISLNLQSIKIFDQLHDTLGLIHGYGALGNLYGFLGLDSNKLESLRQIERYKLSSASHYLKPRIIAGKAEAFKSLFATERKRFFADSARFYIGKLLSDSTHMEWHSYAWCTAAAISILDSQFQQGLTEIEMALSPQVTKRNATPEMEGYTWLVKGYLLCKTGNRQIGLPIIEKYFNPISVDQIGIMACEELLEATKSSGDWKKALQLSERLRMSREKAASILNRGKVFEITQKFNFAHKEAEVKSLQTIGIAMEKKRDKEKSIVLITLLLFTLLVLILFIRNKSMRIRKLISENKMKKLKEELLLQEKILRVEQHEAVMAQRIKLSEDIHDGLSGSLASLRFYIEDLKMQNDNEVVLNILGVINEEVETIYHNTRSYTYELKDSIVGQPNYTLTELLKRKKARLSKNNDSFKLFTDYDEEVINARLSQEQQFQLFHIFREALVNIMKHADATAVTIRIFFLEEDCSFYIADNGKGFNSKILSEGMGLQSMQHRVKGMDGSLIINTSARGTTITGLFPLK